MTFSLLRKVASVMPLLGLVLWLSSSVRRLSERVIILLNVFRIYGPNYYLHCNRCRCCGRPSNCPSHDNAGRRDSKYTRQNQTVAEIKVSVLQRPINRRNEGSYLRKMQSDSPH